MGEVQGRAAAYFVGDIMKKKNVTLITLNNDFGQSLSAGFKEVAGNYGVKVASEYTYAMGDRQFGSIVASVKRDNPDMLYVSGYFFNGGPLVAQLRAGGVTAPILGTEGFDTHNFIKIAGPAAEGVMITTSLDRDSKSPAMRKFIDDYEKKFNTPADMVAASTNTAINVAAAAIGKAGSDDPAKIRDAIAGTKDFQVATGRISFNELGEVYKAAQIQVIKGGKFHHQATIDNPQLLAPPTK